nr:C45 family peptidase [Deinobacterium chartae]
MRLEGSARAQGRAHGETLRAEVRNNLEVYFARFEAEGLPRAAVLERAQRYLYEAFPCDPDYLEGLYGLAEGAGVDLTELAALNARYEILYDRFSRRALADGCTSVAVEPGRSADGHTWLAQNWDWIPHVRCALLHTVEPDLEVLAFTEAGIFGGKLGLNSYGLGLCINGLQSTADGWARLRTPFHARTRQVLRARSLEAARASVEGEVRNTSGNFLIAQAGQGAIDLEAAPETLRALRPQQGLLVHANHFENPAVLGVAEPPRSAHSSTLARAARVRELAGRTERIGRADLERFLRDPKGAPYGVCRRVNAQDPPIEHYLTVTSVIMDLEERALWLTDGPPDTAEYRCYRLGELKS